MLKLTESAPIVCGTDFSENARQGCTAAAALAKRRGLPLIVVHVSDELGGFADSPEQIEAFLQPLRELLNVEVRWLSASGVTVSAELFHGCAAEKAFGAYAAKQAADLVMFSAVSKTVMDQWTNRSFTERIAQP